MDRPLAVGLGVAHDNSPPVILQGPRQNFGGGRTESIDHDDQWPRIGNGGIVVWQRADAAALAHLHRVAGADEQPGHHHRFVQGAAPVAA